MVRTLRPRVRRVWLTAHVGASVGWLGAATVMLALAVIGAVTGDLDLRHQVYVLMGLLNFALVIPSVALALVSGVVLSLGAKWGLVRHWWVLVKFAVSLAIPVFTGSVASRWMGEADALTEADRAAVLPGTDVRLWICFAVFTALLWFATTLSTVKPWGRTRWGRAEIARNRRTAAV